MPGDDAIRELLLPIGQDAIALARRLRDHGCDELQILERLRRTFSPELSRWALRTAVLREKARSKFRLADQMYFTREGLEQATSEPVARHRAKRYEPFRAVADFACGIGGDTIALAGVVERVRSVDIDAIALRFAQENAAVYRVGRKVSVQTADLTREAPLAGVEAVFFDPCRRSHGKRFISVERYSPSLSIVHKWRDKVEAIGVKLAPAVDLNQLAQYGGEIEFISLAGELKECVLWLGALQTTRRRATILPQGATLVRRDGVQPAKVGRIDTFLYDPDPAVIRAGLIAELAEQVGAWKIDETIAYLTAPAEAPTPFATAYRVEAVIPFHQRRLRDLLRSHDIGHLTIKRRGTAVDSTRLEKSLDLAGDRSGTLFLTRSQGKHVAILAQPCSRPDGPVGSRDLLQHK